MDKVNVIEISAYSWKCPECGYQNITDVYAILTCDGCGKRFEKGNEHKRSWVES